MDDASCSRLEDCECARCGPLRLDMMIVMVHQTLAKHYLRIALSESNLADRHQALAKHAAFRAREATSRAEDAAHRIGKTLGYDPFDAATADVQTLLDEARKA